MPQDDHPPAFLIYPRDILFDEKTEHMTASEFGAYTRILLRSWHQKPVATIPTDDRVLAGWANLTPAEWTECRPAVLLCFKSHGKDRFIQPRLAKEYQKLVAKKKIRSEAGKVGAESRWGKDDSKRMANACDCYGNAIAKPSVCYGIQPNNPNNPKTHNNPLTQNKDPHKTQGGLGDDAAAPPGEVEPPGSLNSSSLGSRVHGLSPQTEVPVESMGAMAVFVLFRDLFSTHSITGANELGKKVKACKTTPALWTMLFLDKVQYAMKNGGDPVALTMAGFASKQTPTDAASGLFRQIIIDTTLDPDGRGKRWGYIDGKLIASELTKRKGKHSCPKTA